MNDRRNQRQRDMAAVITYIAALALMAVVPMPRPALSEPYSVPKEPIFMRPIPACAHRDVLIDALRKARHEQSWSGLHEAHPAHLTLFVARDTRTWFLVEIKTDSVLACIRARGNESRLHFGDPM